MQEGISKKKGLFSQNHIYCLLLLFFLKLSVISETCRVLLIPKLWVLFSFFFFQYFGFFGQEAYGILAWESNNFLDVILGEGTYCCEQRGDSHQGPNSHPLHWKVKSQTQDHQRNSYTLSSFCHPLPTPSTPSLKSDDEINNYSIRSSRFW